MRARRIPVHDLANFAPDALTGAVLLAPVSLPGGSLSKGTPLGRSLATGLIAAAAAGQIQRPVRLAWPDPDDLHEDDAAEQLAVAAAGAGVDRRAPRQSRLDLIARWDGVLQVRVAGLIRVNAVDPLEIFTLFHGQAVAAGEVIGSIKVAPHLVAGEAVREGVRIAGEEAPLIAVRPYLAMDVGAIVEEAISPDALGRFEAGARHKVEALGSRFVGTTVVGDADSDAAEVRAREALIELVRRRGLPVVLVGGVSAGDPVSSFFAALDGLGGAVLRRGVPAHPGSMIWLARLDQATLLGLPQCGMFTMATAADLILPRLLTGETLDVAALADLGHGGLLGREMRFRFPAYARDMRVPEGR